MLVLAMRRDERVFITTADGTRVELLAVEFPAPGKVRLGFAVPPGVSILREKLYDRIVANGGDPRDGLDRGKGQAAGGAA